MNGASIVIIETDECRVELDDSPEARDMVFQKIVDFFKEHGCWSGESICQSDAPQINSPELLSDIADDILQPEVTWKDA